MNYLILSMTYSSSFLEVLRISYWRSVICTYCSLHLSSSEWMMML
jgi:hypothetical protein